MSLRSLAAFLAALALPLAACTATSAQETIVSSRADAQSATASVESPWPFAESDLPVDPSYRVGVLDNGMRYIIRPNATPPEQGMVQFWVDFGSVAEAEHQQGWAHFIEHMAFNGSTHLPEGEMVKLLEREGLAFGADTNASTGFDTTLYRLDLPRNDLDLLDTALMLMRENASELTFDEGAVERERGIVLSEINVRDTYQFRAAKDLYAFTYPGSRLSRRFPAGTPETVGAATGAEMKQLWETYYRPENVALVVVGDYDVDAVEAAIAEHFADWQGEDRVAQPGFGPIAVDQSGAADIYLDPALPDRLVVSANGAWLGGPDTEESRRIRLRRAIGNGIINRRLQRLARQDDPPFRAATIDTSDIGEEGRTTSISIYALDGEWQRGLAAAQEEYRSALAFGFSESEVAEQVANFRASVDANAAGAATRPNSSFVTGAITLLRDRQVPTTPQSGLERFNSHAPLITPANVLEALREEIVPLDDPLVRYEGKAPPEGGEAALLAAWSTGMETELAQRELADLAEFAYQDFGTPGTITSDTVIAELGIRTVSFANGLKLNLKKTDLQQDRVLLELNVDGGEMLNTRDDPLKTALASFLPQGGLGHHTYDELLSILAGRNVSFNFSTDTETFQLGAQTTPSDLELQLQLFAAALSDAAFRPAGEAQARQNIRAFFARSHATPGAALSFEIGEIVSDGDPRFTYQSEEAYMALTFAKMRDDLQGRLQNGALELALVGDIDEDRAIALVAATVGALPAREAQFLDYAENRERHFTADRTPRVIYHDGEANQALLALSWPTRDDSDHLANLELELLERVARIALTDILREELGQTYSPSASASQSRFYPGYGSFNLSASLDAAHVDEARDVMLATLESLRNGGITEDLLLRARRPLLEQYDNQLDTNRGWMVVTDRAQSEPDRIARFLTGRDKLAAITPAQLQAVALTYLDPAKRLDITVMPRPSQ